MTNKLNIGTCFLNALLLSFGIISNVSADLYNVGEFEINGLRFGMSVEEAQKELAEYYSINPKEMKIDRIAEPYPGTDYVNSVSELTYRSDTLFIVIGFEPSSATMATGTMVLTVSEAGLIVGVPRN